VVYVTVDAGRTWSTAGRTLLSPKKVHFVDQKTGWLIGSIGEKCGSAICPNVVMLSDDGGKTWNRVSTVSGELVDETAFSGNEAWALGQVCHDAAQCSAEFVRTTTAGQIWDNQNLPLVGRDFHVERYGRTVGWVGGTVDGGQGTALLRSVDGGSTWAPVTLPCQGSWSRFDSFSAKDGWLICSPDAAGAVAISIARIYRTSDGGETWSQLTTITDSSGPTLLDGKAGKDPVGGFHFASIDIGWLALSDGRLFGTDDGGRTWRKVLTDAGGFLDVQSVDHAQGWLLGQRQVWRTTDTGKTWTATTVVSTQST
jgi:photosystem II stability/assembly factor-like uncharacterized protein